MATKHVSGYLPIAIARNNDYNWDYAYNSYSNFYTGGRMLFELPESESPITDFVFSAMCASTRDITYNFALYSTTQNNQQQELLATVSLTHGQGPAELLNADFSAVSLQGGEKYILFIYSNQTGSKYIYDYGAGFTVAYTATAQVIPVNTPTAGNIPVDQANTFRASFEVTSTSSVYDPFTFASASLYWRNGSSGPFTQAAMSGSGTTAWVTIPANTFSTGTVQWYMEATDNTGNTTLTETYFVNAIASALSSTPKSPDGVLMNNTLPIILEWETVSTTETEQYGADLRYSTDGETWIALPFSSGSQTWSEIAANTFPSGKIYWQVRPYVSATSYGDWSESASFDAFGAPTVDAVSATAAPFATIRWQTEGQVSVEIKVDGNVIGPIWGADVRSYELSEPLADGLHDISVRAQNRFGLWGEWGDGVCYISNIGGWPVTLTATGGENVSLSWTTAAQYANFYVYRDGVLIARTTETAYTDAAVLGEHSYYVLNRKPDNNYAKSTTVTAAAAVDCPTLTPQGGGEPLRLRLSAEAHREQQYQRSRRVAWVHYSGARYPEAEIGAEEDYSGEFDAAWTHEQTAEAAYFESLLGSPVILKTPAGAVVSGVLAGYERRDPRFYKKYTFSLRQSE